MSETGHVVARSDNAIYSPHGTDVGAWRYHEPWPRPWSQPYPVPYPVPTPIVNTFTTHVAPAEEYANEVEVTRGEHDAVLRFYRKRANSRSLVKEITVPLGLLAFLEGQS